MHIALLHERCKVQHLYKKKQNMEVGGIKGIVRVCVIQNTFFKEKKAQQ